MRLQKIVFFKNGREFRLLLSVGCHPFTTVLTSKRTKARPGRRGAALGKRMLNHSALEAVCVATYAEDYLDFVENFANVVQPGISSIRRLDAQYFGKIRCPPSSHVQGEMRNSHVGKTGVEVEGPSVFWTPIRHF